MHTSIVNAFINLSFVLLCGIISVTLNACFHNMHSKVWKKEGLTFVGETLSVLLFLYFLRWAPLDFCTCARAAGGARMRNDAGALENSPRRRRFLWRATVCAALCTVFFLPHSNLLHYKTNRKPFSVEISFDVCNTLHSTARNFDLRCASHRRRCDAGFKVASPAQRRNLRRNCRPIYFYLQNRLENIFSIIFFTNLTSIFGRYFSFL